MMRAAATMRTRSSGSTGGGPPTACRAPTTSALIGTLSGCGSRLASVWSSRARSVMVSPMPIMPPQQTWSPRRRTRCKRIQPLLIGSRGDDLAVELGRGVEIVVIGGEPGLGEAVGLVLAQHAEGDARLHAELRGRPAP